MIEFPHLLLREAVTSRPRLVGAARTGGRSASGVMTTSRADGGGLWAYGLQAIAITTPDLVRTFEAVTALMAEGARPIVVPICDKRHYPALMVDGAPIYTDPALSGIPHSDTALFSDGSGYAQSLINVYLGAGVPLRETELTLELEQAGTLKGGELFSINHSVLGWRFYRIVAVDMLDATVARVTIEPPLREGAGTGTPIEFDYPRCVMQLAEPVTLELEMRRHGRPSLSFIESFLPLD